MNLKQLSFYFIIEKDLNIKKYYEHMVYITVVQLNTFGL